MIRILHLSYSGEKTGAGIAAKRIHSCICDYKDSSIKSFLMTNNHCYENSKIILKKNSIKRFYNFFKKYLERIIINLIDYEDNLFHSISVFPTLKHNEINNLDIDLVHLHWVQHETISIEEIGKIKFPIVWTLHDCWPFSATEHYQKGINDKRYILGYKINNKFKISEYVDKFCLFRKKLSWSKTIYLIAPSKWMRDCAKDSFLMKDKRIVMIPNPINTSKFKPINKNKSREKLKIKLNKKVILFGSIDGGKDPRKGADLLVDVLNFLNNTENIQIVIFGKRNKHQDIFKNTNLEILNLGEINSYKKLSIIYSACDIFVIPSRIESFGQTAAEAQSCGIPVVGFDIGGLKDIITHNENGILIEPFNTKKMALAIEKLLREDDKITKLSKASRQNAIDNFDFLKVAKSHIDFYKNILNYE